MKLIHRDSIFRQSITIRTDLQLWRLHLLLNTDINCSGNLIYISLDVIADHIHPAQIRAEDLNSYTRTRSRKHMVNTVP